MLTVKKLRRKPKHFHNFTGLTPEHFDELLTALEPLYEQNEHERLENPNRLRARGAGRNFNLELPERLLMSLMYIRLYVTQTELRLPFRPRLKQCKWVRLLSATVSTHFRQPMLTHTLLLLWACGSFSAAPGRCESPYSRLSRR